MPIQRPLQPSSVCLWLTLAVIIGLTPEKASAQEFTPAEGTALRDGDVAIADDTMAMVPVPSLSSTTELPDVVEETSPSDADVAIAADTMTVAQVPSLPSTTPTPDLPDVLSTIPSDLPRTEPTLPQSPLPQTPLPQLPPPTNYYRPNLEPPFLPPNHPATYPPTYESLALR